ncbi:hypothetical protein ABB02_00697 [Clostridiaceae bacterium JG1575]|nr:hypothetical protein ABB02_00697 [Clostridiaceae bacterium JG1575]
MNSVGILSPNRNQLPALKRLLAQRPWAFFDPDPVLPLGDEALLSRLLAPQTQEAHQGFLAVQGEVIAWFSISVRYKDRLGILHLMTDRNASKQTLSRGLGALLSHSFNDLALHKCTMNLPASERPLLDLLRDLGFHREAIFREELRRGDSFEDVYAYGLLAEQWRS